MPTFVVLGLMVLSAPPAQPDRPVGSLPAEAAKKVHIGMTAHAVQTLLGPPTKVARQILYRRSMEQWTYASLPALVIEFNFIKGQDARAVAVYRSLLPSP